MKSTFKPILIILVMLALFAGTAYAIDEITNFSGVHVKGDFGTATPALMVDTSGNGVPFEVRYASTPVFSVASSGDLTYAGGMACSAPLALAAPTAIGTATPGLVINSSSNKPNLFEARAAATPMFSVGNTGNVIGAGSLSVGPAYANAPSGVGTATPALMVNSAAAAGNLLEVRKAATPQFTVGNDGTVTGKTLRYATAGMQLICGTSTVTDTATIASGLTTVQYCFANLNQVVAGDARSANCRASSGNVIVDVKNSNATPAANAVGAVTMWCAVGTP